MTLTRRGQIVARAAETTVVAVALLILYGAAWAVGFAHPSWSRMGGVVLGIALAALVLVAVVDRFLSHTPKPPAERDGVLDNASNPIRDESDHSRAKYRSHR